MYRARNGSFLVSHPYLPLKCIQAKANTKRKVSDNGKEKQEQVGFWIKLGCGIRAVDSIGSLR